MIRVIEGSLSDRVIQYLDTPERTPRTIREIDKALNTIASGTVWHLTAKGVLKVVDSVIIGKRPLCRYKLVGETARVTRGGAVLKPTVRQQAILAIVERDGRVKSGAVAEELGLSVSRVRTDMVALKKGLKIELVCVKVGRCPEWYWQVYGTAKRNVVRPAVRKPTVTVTAGNPIADFIAMVGK